MPEATPNNIDAPAAPLPTRRGILAAASAATLAIGAMLPTRAIGTAMHPDAELFAECERFKQGEAEYIRLCLAADHEWTENVTPAMQAQTDAFAAHSEAHHARGYWLANYQPKTIEGIRAKARAALVYIGPNDPIEDMISALERSILFNLAGVGLPA